MLSLPSYEAIIQFNFCQLKSKVNNIVYFNALQFSGQNNNKLFIQTVYCRDFLYFAFMANLSSNKIRNKIGIYIFLIYFDYLNLKSI